MRKILSIFLVVLPLLSVAQFAPPAGQEGTTAMHADSSAFVAWATGIEVVRGPMNIANPSLGNASFGTDITVALGVPGGTMDVISLGDGGSATLTFDSPICNGPGPDFAVFENGMANAQNTSMYFLELAFVEVSSDGKHFFRFPAVTNVPYDTQLGGFACIDPQQIHNLASKYEAMYGTPFDLDEVPDNPQLNKNRVTHVRLVDVVGNIDPEYATYDSQGHPVNDPWPTPFNSSGFDLDAVGVIHNLSTIGLYENPVAKRLVYPNPAVDQLVLDESVSEATIYSMMGQKVLTSSQKRVDVSTLAPGVYVIHMMVEGNVVVNKFTKK
ncbi:MAG: T9SS type A sorting domain-containing protein [Bacteroidales bacterium]|nr:T9SS type A sorting domain-containing protein [Bacteroidales bacterium]